MEELKINTWLWPPLNCESRQILGNNLPQKQPPEVFCKKRVLKNFANFPGKHLQSLFNKVTGLKACISIKKRLQHRCFLRNLQNFPKHLFWRTSVNDCFYFYKHKEHHVNERINIDQKGIKATSTGKLFGIEIDDRLNLNHRINNILRLPQTNPTLS